MTIPELTGIRLVETGYAPRGIAILLGRIDSSIHYYGQRIPTNFVFGPEMIGKIDFNTGEMELLKHAFIQEIRADEPTLDRLKQLLKQAGKESKGAGNE